MAKDEIVGFCVICGKDIKKGKWSAMKKGDLWVCGVGCGMKYNKQYKEWTAEKWGGLRQKQALYEDQQQTEKESESLLESIDGKAKELLDETLQPEETTHILIKGSNGYLVGTDRRAIIMKIGLASGSLFERLSLQSIAKCHSFPYEHISGFELKRPGTLSLGHISISAPSSGDSLHIFHGTENKVDFAFDQYERFSLAVKEMEELKNAIKSKPETVVITSIPEQIKQLAELRDMGALTSEEFEAKKSELLNRL
ncbi:MAG: SHOCT domain-containing protein [Dehalococcoidia bacterium]|nr:SHOCT domain-containing protein [Dehalococcoidia bacterium]